MKARVSDAVALGSAMGLILVIVVFLLMWQGVL